MSRFKFRFNHYVSFKKLLFSLLLLVTFVQTYAAEKMKFVVVSDVHFGEKVGPNETKRDSLKSILHHIRKYLHYDQDPEPQYNNPVNYLVITGDLVHNNVTANGLADCFKILRDSLVDKNIKLLICRGNHQSTTPTISSMWNTELSKTVNNSLLAERNFGVPNLSDGFSYYHQSQDYSFVMIDVVGNSNTYNEEWLKDVRPNLKKRTFFFGHYGIFGGRLASTYISNGDKLAQLMADNGWNQYFCGHDHFFNHAEISKESKKVNQFILAPAGGERRGFETYIPQTSSTWTPEEIISVNNDVGFTIVEIIDNGSQPADMYLSVYQVKDRNNPNFVDCWCPGDYHHVYSYSTQLPSINP
ncbi:MAG: metallophosphoesterase [Chitinivibrionales bacterium]|nr:metallophosphoesterase [Chitinivibrionales bacterium]